MTPIWIERLLESSLAWFLARLFGTFFYWFAGIGFLLNFDAATGAVQGMGLAPVVPIAALTIFVQLVGSLLVIADRMVWLGTGMLATFTIATLFVAHDWWNMEGAARQQHYLESQEHLTVLGGLLGLTILSHIRARWLAERIV